MSQIQNKFIANNAVTETKIADNSVTTNKINNGAVTNDKVATGIDASKLADGSVSNAELQRLNGVTGDIQTQLDAKVDESREGQPNGIATLDGGGKVPVSQLPSAVMTYEGVYNATTNSPALIDGTGDAGMVYRVGTAGTQNFGSGNITFNVGDYVIYNGTTWEKSDTTDAVASVNGQTGIVTLDTDDIAEGANLYFTDERAQDAVGAALTDTASVDLTYNDGANTITATVLPAGVDHDSLQNFVANKHIDHSTVNIATPANGGLSGGGNITTSRNIILDVNNLNTITPDSADLLPLYDVSGTVTGKATVANVAATTSANRTLSNLTAPTSVNEDLFIVSGKTLVLANNNSLAGRNAANNANIPIIRVSTSNNVEVVNTIIPSVDDTYNLGANGKQFNNIYTTNLNSAANLTISSNAVTEVFSSDEILLAPGNNQLILAPVVAGSPSLILQDDTGTQGISIKSPTGLAASYTITLPPDDGTNGQVLQTNGSGVTTWVTPSSGYTDEQAQDAVGNILTDSASIDFTYNDAGNTITAAVLPAGVDHDALNNFVANEHVDHSTVNIATSATSGLTGGGDITTTRNISVQPDNATLVTAAAGDLILVADVSDSNNLKKVTAQTIANLAPVGTFNKETFTLSAGDITNQYIDLAQVAKTNSIHFIVKGGAPTLEGASHDYSVSYTGGAGGNTRITFLNDLATGGPAALVATDVIQVAYQY